VELETCLFCHLLENGQLLDTCLWSWSYLPTCDLVPVTDNRYLTADDIQYEMLCVPKMFVALKCDHVQCSFQKRDQTRKEFAMQDRVSQTDI